MQSPVMRASEMANQRALRPFAKESSSALATLIGQTANAQNDDRQPAKAVLRSLPQDNASRGILTAMRAMARWSTCAKRLLLAVTILALFLPLNGSSAARLKTPHQRPGSQSFATRIGGYVSEAAQRFSIPATWIYAVMHVESQGVRHAISPKGAMGLMQIMPKTWTDLQARYGLGGDPFEPRDNILAGAAYLREMHDRYGAPGFLAAYNAGPDRYEDYRDRHRPLPAETRAYVARLAPAIDAQPLPQQSSSDPIAAFLTAATSLFASPTQAQSLVVQTAEQKQPHRTISRAPVHDLTAITPRSTGLFARLSNTEQAR